MAKNECIHEVCKCEGICVIYNNGIYYLWELRGFAGVLLSVKGGLYDVERGLAACVLWGRIHEDY